MLRQELSLCLWCGESLSIRSSDRLQINSGVRHKTYANIKLKQAFTVGIADVAKNIYLQVKHGDVLYLLFTLLVFLLLIVNLLKVSRLTIELKPIILDIEKNIR